jgi:CheY-like chemotaxis protein
VNEPPEEPASYLPSLLMVEDDENAVNLVRIITKGKYSVDHARTSEAALDIVCRKQYDIILMDINLGKGGSGVVVTKQIRQIESYKNTPIVALTAFALMGDREEFLAAGCSHYLSKPFNKQQLLALLKEISKDKEL